MDIFHNIPFYPYWCPKLTFFFNNVLVSRKIEALSQMEHFMYTYGAFPLHGTVRYGSLLGGFPLGTVPGTFLVPPQPRFQAIRTVTKT